MGSRGGRIHGATGFPTKAACQRGPTAHQAHPNQQMTRDRWHRSNSRPQHATGLSPNITSRCNSVQAENGPRTLCNIDTSPGSVPGRHRTLEPKAEHASRPGTGVVLAHQFAGSPGHLLRARAGGGLVHVHGTMPSLGNLPHHTMAVCRTPGDSIPKLGVIITLVPSGRRKIGQLPRPAYDPILT